MEIKEDAFLNGRIRVVQECSGYRFSLDAVILAFYARPHKTDRILDLGTGCGIISLIMAYRQPDIFVYGVEVQRRLAVIAEQNVSTNRMEDRIRILQMDMKALTEKMISGPVDLVVSNPPYRVPNSGRTNPDQQRAVARHEIKITLKEVVETARRMLKNKGRFLVIISAERLTDILTMLRLESMEPKRIVMIHSRAGSDAKMVLVEGVKMGRSGLTIRPPLYIYKGDGIYTESIEKMFLP